MSKKIEQYIQDLHDRIVALEEHTGLAKRKRGPTSRKDRVAQRQPHKPAKPVKLNFDEVKDGELAR